MSNDITNQTSVNNINNEQIKEKQKQEAFESFLQLAGFNLDGSNLNTTVIDRSFLNSTAFYMFFPVFVVFVIGIMFAVGAHWITWPAGVYLAILTFIILYGFNMLYRMQINNSGVCDKLNIKNKLNAFVSQDLIDMVTNSPTNNQGVACRMQDKQNDVREKFQDFSEKKPDNKSDSSLSDDEDDCKKCKKTKESDSSMSETTSSDFVDLSELKRHNIKRF